MRLTDDELHTLVARHPSNPELLKELRYRVRWSLLKRMPNPTGVCPHGARIEWDHKGAYSSGYPMGCRRCINDGHAMRLIVNDPPTPYAQRILDTLDTLR